MGRHVWRFGSAAMEETLLTQGMGLRFILEGRRIVAGGESHWYLHKLCSTESHRREPVDRSIPTYRRLERFTESRRWDSQGPNLCRCLWVEPPEQVEKTIQPRQGRQTRLSPPPLRGWNISLHQFRWLRCAPPPANIRCASGAKTCAALHHRLISAAPPAQRHVPRSTTG
jgi:hypothetical protein